MEFEILKKAISTVMCVDPEEIKMETTFVEDLGADSLDVFQIIMTVEEDMAIELDVDAVQKIRTVSEAVELIKKTEGN